MQLTGWKQMKQVNDDIWKSIKYYNKFHRLHLRETSNMLAARIKITQGTVCDCIVLRSVTQWEQCESLQL